MNTRRHGRLVLSHHPLVGFRWLPALLWTSLEATSPYVWRLFWGTFCIAWLKEGWSKPQRLTRQLRRQLERKGRLVFAAACLLAAILCPAAGRAEAWCSTADAGLARAILNFKSLRSEEFGPGERSWLLYRAQRQEPCHSERPGAASEMRKAKAERDRQRAIEDAVRLIRELGDEARRAAR